MKRITILAGHYGSGKSEICVNLALKYKLDYLVDIDIINPYFRTRALYEMFKEVGITLVESTIEEKPNSDMPYISRKGVIPFIRKDITAIYDLGGTENGAKVLIQYADSIKDLSEIDYICVINIFRLETSSVEKILETITLLEAQTQLKITGLINNSNLINETVEQDIIDGEVIIEEVSRKLNITILYTVVEESRKNYKHDFLGERLILTRHVAKKWL